MTLMEEYARNVPDELAERRMAQINKAAPEHLLRVVGRN
jgi:hypothetical protein